MAFFRDLAHSSQRCGSGRLFEVLGTAALYRNGCSQLRTVPGIYSPDSGGAVGPPPTLAVLSLYIALCSLLENASHIPVHHIGTEGPGGERASLQYLARAPTCWSQETPYLFYLCSMEAWTFVWGLDLLGCAQFHCWCLICVLDSGC